jgi:hypothetical protein
MNDLNNTIDKLKDIKASNIIQIDFLPYILMSGGFIVVLTLIIFLILYFKNKRKKKPNKIEIAKQNLKNLDFTKDTKDIVYGFTVNAYECLDDKNKDELEQIIKKLEPYKYKKVVTKISNDLIDDMKDYIKVRV